MSSSSSESMLITSSRAVKSERSSCGGRVARWEERRDCDGARSRSLSSVRSMTVGSRSRLGRGGCRGSSMMLKGEARGGL